MKLNEIKDNKGSVKIRKRLVEVLAQELVKPQARGIKAKKLDLVYQSKVLKVVKCPFIEDYQKEDLLT